MSNRYYMGLFLVTALAASSTLEAGEQGSGVAGHIAGYDEIAKSARDSDDPNLVVLQTLLRDLDNLGEAVEADLKVLSDRAFLKLVEDVEDRELRERLRRLEPVAARAELVLEVRRDLLGKKMALFERMNTMSPEEARRAIGDLRLAVEKPGSGQAFIEDFAVRVGTLVGGGGGFVVGYTVFQGANVARIAGAGVFLVAVKLLSYSRKASYIGWQYTKQFWLGIWSGIREGLRTRWKVIGSDLDEEQSKLESP